MKIAAALLLRRLRGLFAALAALLMMVLRERAEDFLLIGSQHRVDFAVGLLHEALPLGFFLLWGQAAIVMDGLTRRGFAFQDAFHLGLLWGSQAQLLSQKGDVFLDAIAMSLSMRRGSRRRRALSRSTAQANKG